MALKKTVSILCLLASTALVHAAPTYTYLSKVYNGPYDSDNISVIQSMAYDGTNLYIGYTSAVNINGTRIAIVNKISDFNGANPGEPHYKKFQKMW